MKAMSATLAATSGITTPLGSQVPSFSTKLVRCSDQTASMPPVSMIIAMLATADPSTLAIHVYWGLVCDGVAPQEIQAGLFFRYNRGNLAQAGAATAPFGEALERARLLVAAMSAGCAVFLFLIARRVGGLVADEGSVSGGVSRDAFDCSTDEDPRRG